MNFNYILLLTTIFTCSCGVKSDPIPPQDTLLPSIMNKYTQRQAKELPTDLKSSENDEDDNENKATTDQDSQ